jgi:hypothetical protein
MKLLRLASTMAIISIAVVQPPSLAQNDTKSINYALSFIDYACLFFNCEQAY